MTTLFLWTGVPRRKLIHPGPLPLDGGRRWILVLVIQADQIDNLYLNDPTRHPEMGLAL